MNFIKKILKPIKDVILIYNARRVAGHLSREKNQYKKYCANAIEDTVNNDLSQEEKEWIGRIESIRRELNQSTDEISIIDYGAGPSNDIHSKDDMDRGVVTKINIGDVCKRASKSYLWALLLFKIIREFKPINCLEMGTCFGISASYQSAALKLNNLGKLVTMEGSTSLAVSAQNQFNRLSLDNIEVVVGRFQDKLSDVLKELKPVDYVFIDGHHDEEATLEYFDQIFPSLSESAVIVFDDIYNYKGVKNAWKTIIADERITISINMFKIGICGIDKSLTQKSNYYIPLFGGEVKYRSDFLLDKK